jgi:hypothetical protein
MGHEHEHDAQHERAPGAHLMYEGHDASMRMTVNGTTLT